MRIAVELNSQDVTRILEQEVPRKVRNALRSAVRTTATWANKELDKRMAESAQLPRKVFKKHRIKRFEKLDASSIESVKLWLGYRRVAAKWAGNLVQLKGRLRVGKYKYPRGFIWRGHVFQRTQEKYRMTKGRYVGKMRQRIVKQYIAMPDAPNVAANVAAEARQELLRRFLTKFNAQGVSDV